ncbi:hypothetical protein DXA16_06020 [Streptococcus anginosus]|nr:hypothetical protein DXA16_06020 [Streptococcus anginosus]
MIPKFRAWLPALKWMCGVSAILFDEESIDVYKADDAERVTEMNVHQDEVTLMQSTGLKDKNGKEIFEGDIVKTTRFFGRADEIGGFYEYDKKIMGVVKQLEGAWVIDTGSEAVDLWTEIEENSVIGNVWEDGGLIDN